MFSLHRSMAGPMIVDHKTADRYRLEALLIKRSLWNKIVEVFMSAIKDSPLQQKLNSIPPKTLDEAVLALNKMLCSDAKTFLKEGGEQAASTLHHTLGRYLRNKWSLWGESELAHHMKNMHGVNHPDDMSHAILTAYCNSLNK